MTNDAEQSAPSEHVFDQTNGVMGDDPDTPERVSEDELTRRRRDASARAYGQFGIGYR